MSFSTPCCGGQAGAQPSLSLLPSLVLLRWLEVFDADGNKNVARVGMEDYHFLCLLLIRYTVRIQSLGNYLFFLVYSFFPPWFHCTLVDHHNHVEIIMKETYLLLTIHWYSDDPSSSLRTLRPCGWCEHKATLNIKVRVATILPMPGQGHCVSILGNYSPSFLQ